MPTILAKYEYGNHGYANETMIVYGDLDFKLYKFYKEFIAPERNRRPFEDFLYFRVANEKIFQDYNNAFIVPGNQELRMRYEEYLSTPRSDRDKKT
jgi:hypothetical protein